MPSQFLIVFAIVSALGAGGVAAGPGSGAAAASAMPRIAAQAGERLYSERFAAAPGGTLVVEVPDADVGIRPGSADGVLVEVFVKSRDAQWGREVYERMRFTVTQENDTVTVRAADPRIGGDERRRNFHASVWLRIGVPGRFDVDASTSDGDIQLGPIQGDVKLRSSDGDVQVAAVEGNVSAGSSDGDLIVERVSGERFSAVTSDGDIVVRELATASARLRTSDGDVMIGRASGSVEASTSDGDVRIVLAQPLGDVSVETNDGDVMLLASPGVTANVDLEGGDVVVDPRFTLSGSQSPRRVEGVLNGGGPLIRARARDGDVVLREGGS